MNTAEDIASGVMSSQSEISLVQPVITAASHIAGLQEQLRRLQLDVTSWQAQCSQEEQHLAHHPTQQALADATTALQDLVLTSTSVQRQCEDAMESAQLWHMELEAQRVQAASSYNQRHSIVALLPNEAADRVVCIGFDSSYGLWPLLPLLSTTCKGTLEWIQRNLHSRKSLSTPSLTDAGLIVLAKQCSGLKFVLLRNCRAVTDAAIVQLALSCALLEVLDLYGCAVTDVGLAAVATHCNLKELDISCTAITDQGVEAIASCCSSLQSFSFSPRELNALNASVDFQDGAFQSALCDTGIQSLAMYCSQIRKLQIANSSVTDNGNYCSPYC